MSSSPNQTAAMLSRALLVAVAIVLILCASGCRARNAHWARADVYLVNWETVTRVGMTPEGARASADFKRNYTASAYKVVDALDLVALRPAGDAKGEDARLVVDLFDREGKRTTYYASYFKLCTADNLQKRPINELFRRDFQTLAK